MLFQQLDTIVVCRCKQDRVNFGKVLAQRVVVFFQPHHQMLTLHTEKFPEFIRVFRVALNDQQ